MDTVQVKLVDTVQMVNNFTQSGGMDILQWIQIFSPFIVAIVAASVGIFVYHKQKEYELVLQRYLIDCIDLICADIDYSLGLFRNNWVRCLQLLKQFRDVEFAMNEKDYASLYIPFDYKHFTITPFIRLKKLIDDNIFF